MNAITITIDGPAGSGKGTTAKGVADLLGYTYIDSGGMYRAITYYCLEHGATSDGITLQSLLPDIHLDITDQDAIIMNGTVMDDEIRTEEINRNVSTIYARINQVRALVNQSCQRIIKSGGYVLDGRDAATTIAPNAELKIFLDCDPHERARRRALEFKDASDENVQKILDEIIIPRDYADRFTLDASRAQGITVDTTNLSITEQIAEVHRLAQEIIMQKS